MILYVAVYWSLGAMVDILLKSIWEEMKEHKDASNRLLKVIRIASILVIWPLVPIVGMLGFISGALKVLFKR